MALYNPQIYIRVLGSRLHNLVDIITLINTGTQEYLFRCPMFQSENQVGAMNGWMHVENSAKNCEQYFASDFKQAS